MFNFFIKLFLFIAIIIASVANGVEVNVINRSKIQIHKKSDVTLRLPSGIQIQQRQETKFIDGSIRENSVVTTPEGSITLSLSDDKFTIQGLSNDSVIEVSSSDVYEFDHASKKSVTELTDQSEKDLDNISGWHALTSGQGWLSELYEINGVAGEMLVDKGPDQCELRKVVLKQAFSRSIILLQYAHMSGSQYDATVAVKAFILQLQAREGYSPACHHQNNNKSVPLSRTNKDEIARRTQESKIQPIMNCNFIAPKNTTYSCRFDNTKACFYDDGDKYCYYKCTPTSGDGGSGVVAGGTSSSPSGGIPYGQDWVETPNPDGSLVVSGGTINNFYVDTDGVIDRYINYDSKLLDNLSSTFESQCLDP